MRCAGANDQTFLLLLPAGETVPMPSRRVPATPRCCAVLAHNVLVTVRNARSCRKIGPARCLGAFGARAARRVSARRILIA